MTTLRAIFELREPKSGSREIVVTADGLRVGRVPDNNDVIFAPKGVSRNHFRLFWQDDVLYLEDLESARGTFLNGARLEADTPVPLKVDDTIEIGARNNPFEFRFLRIEDSQPTTLEGLAEFISNVQEAVQELVSGVGSDDPTPPVVETAGVTSEIKGSADAPPPPYGTPPNMAKSNGHVPGIDPSRPSTWMQYLPEIYSVDDFLGRFLLIFESIFNPLEWYVDHFDLYLSPETAPPAWIQWMASWFDVLVHPLLELERQRDVLRQIPWLFFRRGTKQGLERLLLLYFNVSAKIDEDRPCHFIVTLPLKNSNSALVKAGLGEVIANRLIISQKPAFADFELRIE